MDNLLSFPPASLPSLAYFAGRAACQIERTWRENPYPAEMARERVEFEAGWLDEFSGVAVADALRAEREEAGRP